ncbi:MAG: hypothetical protein AVDCRST_MAG89-4465, partial [uncultured Gemmatimonadetes bacterium]
GVDPRRQRHVVGNLPADLEERVGPHLFSDRQQRIHVRLQRIPVLGSHRVDSV